MTPLNAQRRRHAGDGHGDISTRAAADTSAELGQSARISARTVAEASTEISTRTGVSTRAIADAHTGISARTRSRTSPDAQAAGFRPRPRRRTRARSGARAATGTAAVLTAALFLLTGCKSANSQGNNPPPGAPPAAPGVPSGSGSATPNAAGSADFSYGGTENDSAHVASSACVVSGSDVISFRTPASGSTPKLSATKSGQSWNVSLTTAHSAGYTAHAATGITTSDDGGVRSVSLDGVTLTSGSGSVTLSGTVLCGRAA